MTFSWNDWETTSVWEGWHVSSRLENLLRSLQVRGFELPSFADK